MHQPFCVYTLENYVSGIPAIYIQLRMSVFRTVNDVKIMMQNVNSLTQVINDVIKRCLIIILFVRATKFRSCFCRCCKNITKFRKQYIVSMGFIKKICVGAAAVVSSALFGYFIYKNYFQSEEVYEKNRQNTVEIK